MGILVEDCENDDDINGYKWYFVTGFKLRSYKTTSIM